MNGTYISSFDWMLNLCISFCISQLVKRYFYELERLDMWCIYGILLCIAYAGCVDLYRLWKRRKGVDSNGRR